MGLSLFQQVKALPEQERLAWLDTLPEATVREIAARPWWFVARPEQQEPPGDWSVWLILSGRGWGKTRTGSEWIVQQVLDNPTAPDGTPTEWAVMGETFSDTRVVCVEGPSGIIRVLESRGLQNQRDFLYNRSAWQILFPNGQKVHMFGADNPDAGRGYNLSGLWADEIAKWRYSYEAWHEGLAPALRIGIRPRAVVTTTPKPIRLLREWTQRSDGSVYVTRGSTFDNAANLSEAALVELQARYAGTRTGQQELYGELLEDADGALWTRAIIEDHRTRDVPPLARIVVAIDPAVTSGEDSDETGLVVAGMAPDNHYYVLEDATMRGTPDAWAREAVNLYRKWKADRIVAEGNNGGDMVTLLLRQVDPTVPVKKVTATRGKRLRAEPISSMYEQGRVHHADTFPELEDQMVTWTPDATKSPDRMDALVWALTELSQGSTSMLGLASLAVFCPNCKMPAPRRTSICPACGTPIPTE